MNHYRRFLLLLLALVLPITLIGCQPKEIPGLTDEQAEAVLAPLLPRSTELMHLFFGEGLAPEQSEIKNEYDGVQYEKVASDQPYQSIAQLKSAMDGVYSTGYKNELSLLMFDGYEPPKDAENEEEIVTDVIHPRYREENGALMVDIKYDGFDVQTVPSSVGAKVISGNATRVSVEIPYASKNGGGGTMRVTLALDGDVWLLDGPTY